jgi:hypothetical protein
MHLQSNPIEFSKFNQTLLVDAFGQSYWFLPKQLQHGEVSGEPVHNSIDRYWVESLLQKHSSIWGYQFDLSRLYQQLSNDYLAHSKSHQDKLNWLSSSIVNGDVAVFRGESFAPTPPTDAEGGVPVAAPSDKKAPKVKSSRSAKRLGFGGLTDENSQIIVNTETVKETGNAISNSSSEDLASLALSKGSSPRHIAARQTVARDYLENNGFTKDQIHDALGASDGSKDGGIDLTQPVEVISFPPPESMTQHVKSHGYPGNWFDPSSNQSPDSLGISGDGRTVKPFKVVEGTGLKSVAKPVNDNWTTPGVDVPCRGGGTQLLVNDNTKSRIIEINPKGI